MFLKNVCVTIAEQEPKPIEQSRSNSISGALMEISRAFFFSFPLSLKLRVVHVRKKIKIFIFSKMAPTIFIKFCGFRTHTKPKNMTLLASPEKIPETIKMVLNVLSVA